MNGEQVLCYDGARIVMRASPKLSSIARAHLCSEGVTLAHYNIIIITTIVSESARVVPICIYI